MVRHLNIWVYILGIISILSLIAYLYILFSEKEYEIKNNMLNHQLETIEIQKHKIKDWLHGNCKDIKNINDCILHNHGISSQLNKLLSIIINQDVRYAFLVYQDRKGRYRFMGDGAENPAKVMQKIDPDNKVLWDKSYASSSKIIISSHKNTDGLWLTYLSPIISKKNHTTKLILVTDFSTFLNKKIQNTIAPIKTILFYILGITIIIFIIGIIQMIMYFHAKQEGYTDELTKLNNRNYLRKILDDKFLYNKYIIAMVDIDYFKKINDQYGHDFGDFVLKKVAELFTDSINKNDFVFRYGGEEFLFLLQKKHYKKHLDLLMNGIRKLDINSYKSNRGVNISISIGVNSELHRYKNFSDMIKSADIALYQAKFNGRNQIIYYSDEIDNTIISNFHVVHAALDEDRVFCEYHAIINTHSKTIYKYEVLVRIIDTDGKILYPNSFIELIKNTNIYTDLTKRIIHIAINKFLNIDKYSFSINLGLQDFNNNEIISYLLDVIEQHPRLLNLMSIEILEYDKVDNEENCINVIKLLQSKGLEIALDDFGSGYANFSTILSYQFNIIKIDGAIIQRINTDDKAIKIVELIVNFAKAQNIIIVCEFVSSKEIYDILVSIGVRYMQGYYFSKPSKELL